jgi:hypothetical protein
LKPPASPEAGNPEPGGIASPPPLLPTCLLTYQTETKEIDSVIIVNMRKRRVVAAHIQSYGPGVNPRELLAGPSSPPTSVVAEMISGGIIPLAEGINETQINAVLAMVDELFATGAVNERGILNVRDVLGRLAEGQYVAQDA